MQLKHSRHAHRTPSPFQNLGVVAARIESAGRLSLGAVAGWYCVVVASNAGHALAYYRLMGQTDSVTTGLMASLRAVGVFVVSAILFCSQQESQCLTLGRAAAAALVVGGVMVYSAGKKAQIAAAALAAGSDGLGEVELALTPGLGALSAATQASGANSSGGTQGWVVPDSPALTPGLARADPSPLAVDGAGTAAAGLPGSGQLLMGGVAVGGGGAAAAAAGSSQAAPSLLRAAGV